MKRWAREGNMKRRTVAIIAAGALIVLAIVGLSQTYEASVSPAAARVVAPPAPSATPTPAPASTSSPVTPGLVARVAELGGQSAGAPAGDVPQVEVNYATSGDLLYLFTAQGGGGSAQNLVCTPVGAAGDREKSGSVQVRLNGWTLQQAGGGRKSKPDGWFAAPGAAASLTCRVSDGPPPSK